MEASLTEVLIIFIDSLFNEYGAREITLGIVTDLILIILPFAPTLLLPGERYVKENPRVVATHTISMSTQERFSKSIWSVNRISIGSGLHNLTVLMKALRWPQLTGITMHVWSFLCLVVCCGSNTPLDGFGVAENHWTIHTRIIITKMSFDT